MKKIFYLGLFIFTTELSAQKLITSTPFELFGDHIFVTVSVDDSDPVSFIFDTGDGLTVINAKVASKLGLKTDHKASRTSAQGSISGALIAHNQIEINDVMIEDVELYSTDLSHLERSIGRSIDGIIGYDLLENYVVSIDYNDMTFKLYDPASFVYTGGGEGFKFKLDSYIPHISGTVQLNNGENIEGEFFINTGAGSTLDFNTPFAAKNDIISKTGKHYSYPVAGIGNQETMHYEGRVKKFDFGNINFENLPIGISQAKHGIQHNRKVAGIIGNKVLRRFNMTLDYKNSMLYLEPNKNFDDPFLVNASGLNLQLSQAMDRVLIHRVFEDSPADKAGIRTDAELISVDGKDAMAYTLPQLRKMLKSVDKKITLVVKQDDEEKEVILDLRELI